MKKTLYDPNFLYVFKNYQPRKDQFIEHIYITPNTYITFTSTKYFNYYHNKVYLHVEGLISIRLVRINGDELSFTHHFQIPNKKNKKPTDNIYSSIYRAKYIKNYYRILKIAGITTYQLNLALNKLMTKLL